MLLLHVLLLSLAVTNTASVQYWVRPDNDTCPPSNQSSQCVTLTDLVTKSMSESFHTSSTRTDKYHNQIIDVIFLPGTHVSNKTGFIVVGNINIPLYPTIRTNFTSISGQQIQIDCQSGHPINFAFVNIASLFLKNMVVKNCGFGHTIKSSILAGNVIEMLVDSVSIFNSRGVGLLITMTAYEMSKEITLNKVIIDGSAHSSSNTSIGGNLYIRMLSTYQENPYTIRSTIRIMIQHSTISNGVSKCTSIANESCPGGMSCYVTGLTPYMVKNIYIMMKNCTFVNNVGEKGGAVTLYLGPTEGLDRDFLKTTINVTIIQSHFMGNKATREGGGLYILGLESFLTISETEFRQNTAEYGGAICTVGTNLYMYHKSTFIDNSAEKGLAIYSKNQQYSRNDFHTINGSLFTQNRCIITDPIRNHDMLCSTIHNEYTVLHIHNVTITENEGRGIYLNQIRLELSGTNTIQSNYALKSDGGALLLDCTSYSDNRNADITYVVADSQSFTSILNNSADGYGGGIAIRDNCRGENYCPFMAPTKTISMQYNTAKQGGSSIFGGSLENCSFWDIFDILDKNISSAVSSLPEKVCICSNNFSHPPNCSTSKHLHTYPGQIFQISMICTGQFGYSSPCKVLAELDETSETSIMNKEQLQDIGLECKKLEYTIKSQQTKYSANLLLTIVKEENLHYKYESTLLSTLITVQVEECPPGFMLDKNGRKCICTKYLAARGITCSISIVQLHKSPPAWVGNHSGTIVVHQNCPLDYCKSNLTNVDPFNQQQQCNFNRNDVLCGACRPGLSLVLGTSRCKKCSNIYLLLLIPFILAGLLLIILLLKCNITVSTGTINGVIFYANVLQATKVAFFPSNSKNTFVKMLSVFVAWLNLDLGIETCFIDGLNMYYRTWLQFGFPLYIWAIIGLLIFISRYSIKVSKWTGSNTVSVLATLFLLSYAKLLRTCFDTFSSTTLTNENETKTSIWLLDGQYTFKEWPHSLLFIAGLVTLFAHIIPFTILLSIAPILQRHSHHKLLHWVNKIKPFLDTYQGPYKNKFRYWTGLLLIARLVILTAVACNVSGNQSINLLVIITVLAVLITILTVLGVKALYRSNMPNFLELFFLVNLLLLAAISLFLQAQNDIQGQNIAISCMVGLAFAITIFIFAYHSQMVCLNTKAVKKLTLYVKRMRNRCPRTGNEAIAEVKSASPTATVVNLKTLLLEEDCNLDNREQ